VASLALRIAGYENVMIYEGSMYEWSRNPQLELVRGLDDVIIEAASVEDDCG